MTIILDKKGGRRIELFLPFNYGNERITSITLIAVRWDHSLKWQEGYYKTSTDLLFDLADQPVEILRQIRYPDVDRILMQFIDMLPQDMRAAITAGEIPRIMTDLEETAAPQEQQQPTPAQPAEAPQLSGVHKEGETKPWPEYPWPPGTPDTPPEAVKETTGVGFQVE